MRNGFCLALLLLALILADGVLLFVVTRATELGGLAARLVSLALGTAMAVLLNRLLPARMALANQPGLRPLLAVVVLLTYGIFATLAIRAPQIQPLAHFGASWLGSLTFLFVGLRRIRRWRDEA